jgi:hypothetical protein
MPGAVLTLRARQELKLEFRLIPAGVISGKILDGDGEALPNVWVQALRQEYKEGKRSLASAARAETNDLGEYRLFGLVPGRYFLSAAFPPWGIGGRESSESVDAREEGYAKMYYPGTAMQQKLKRSPSRWARRFRPWKC